ncbi:MAG: hypothetical protein ACI9JL_001940 [Paracoccaceae bacterium]|jgi:hypothetical protein
MFILTTFYAKIVPIFIVVIFQRTTDIVRSRSHKYVKYSDGWIQTEILTQLPKIYCTA